MNLQYITDSKGQTTGVYIPIKDWNELKFKYKGIEKEEINVPEWHQKLVKERLEKYQTKEDGTEDFDSAMDEIDRDLSEQKGEKDKILTHYASEEVLAKDWMLKEEDEAWKDL